MIPAQGLVFQTLFTVGIKEELGIGQTRTHHLLVTRVNDDFDAALSDLKTILRAERLRMNRQKQRHDALITKLLAD
jgi:hypothetical protein